MPEPTWKDLMAVMNWSRAKMMGQRDIPGAPSTANIAQWYAFLDERAEQARASGSDRWDGEEPDDEGLPGECPYDKAERAEQITFQDAKVREQVIGEGLRNEKLRAEIEALRGDLFTKAQMKDAMAEKDQIILNVIKTLPEIAAASYTGGDKGKVRKLAKSWIKQLMDAINQKVKESQA